jgi:hypothetical protein
VGCSGNTTAIKRSNFEDNVAVPPGGGIVYLSNVTGANTIEGSTFVGKSQPFVVALSSAAVEVRWLGV